MFTTITTIVTVTITITITVAIINTTATATATATANATATATATSTTVATTSFETATIALPITSLVRLGYSLFVVILRLGRHHELAELLCIVFLLYGGDSRFY